MLEIACAIFALIGMIMIFAGIRYVIDCLFGLHPKHKEVVRRKTGMVIRTAGRVYNEYEDVNTGETGYREG